MALNSDEYVLKVYKAISSSEEIISEVRALSLEGSEYIPKLLYSGFYFDVRGWCIIMEIVSGGTFLHHINNRNSIFTAKAKQTINYQLALALEYLHSNNLTHGYSHSHFYFVPTLIFFSDLKPDNVGLNADGHVRLFDFGNSRDIGKGDLVLPKQVVHFSAPEVFQGKPAGAASDRYSYGVVVATFIQKRIPFLDKEEEKVQAAVLKGDFDITLIKSELARDMIKKLLVVDPQTRLKSLTTHEYFTNVLKHPTFIPPSTTLPTVKPEFVDRDVISRDICNDLIKEALRLPAAFPEKVTAAAGDAKPTRYLRK